MEKNSIGGFIAALRKASGMTQRELADRLNVSNKTVSKWECAECYPEITLIPVVAEIFGVTSDEILRGERVPKESAADRPADRTEKQVERLIKSSVTRYKNLCYIAAALAVMGLIISLILAFIIYEPALGFGAMCVFALAGVVLQLINFNRAHCALGADDVMAADAKTARKAFETLFKNAVNVFWIAAAAVLVSLPLVIMFELEWPYGIENMSALNWHLYSARHMALLAVLVYWAAKLAVQGWLSSKGKYSGISMFSHDRRITITGIVICSLASILLI